jgi:hypothetical protein
MLIRRLLLTKTINNNNQILLIIQTLQLWMLMNKIRLYSNLLTKLQYN